MRAWNVYLNGVWIDCVYYDSTCEKDYIKDCLVSIDGYDPAIEIESEEL